MNQGAQMIALNIITRWHIRRLACGLAAFVLSLPAPAPASAQESLEPPEQQLEDLLDLATAYQSSYFQMVAVSCFQLYSSTGIIATDFANGFIDTSTALSALDQNGLLLSVGLTTLTDLQALTPDDDKVARAEIAGLLAILTAEEQLLSALGEVCTAPTEANSAQVEAQRNRVEAALDAYTATEPAE